MTPVDRALRADSADNGAGPDAVWTEVLPLWNAVEVDQAHLDVGFYLRLAVTAGRPVVELGIGTGRVARWTRPDYGVDAAPAVLTTCLAALPQVKLLNARVEEYQLPERVQFSYAPQNLLSLVPKGRALDFFTAVYRNTKPGGRFAFDAAVPDWDRIRGRLGQLLTHGQLGPLRLRHRTELVNVEPDTVQGVLRMHHVVERLDAGGRVLDCRRYPPVSVCYRRPDLVQDLLHAAGWRVEQVWGGFAGEPLTESSRRQVWLASRG